MSVDWHVLNSKTKNSEENKTVCAVGHTGIHACPVFAWTLTYIFSIHTVNNLPRFVSLSLETFQHFPCCSGLLKILEPCCPLK